MIVIIVMIISLISLLLGAFVSFSPNFSQLIETDLTRRVETRAFYYGLEYGKLKERAGLLSGATPTSETIEIDLTKQKEDGAWVVQDKVEVEIRKQSDKLIVTPDRQGG